MPRRNLAINFVAFALVLRGGCACAGALTGQTIAPGTRYSGPPPLPESWPAPTHYISPEGDDSHSGTSPEAPWRSFGHAIPQLQPGDVLGVMDGTYEPDTTGLIEVVGGENAQNGTREAPIIVRAVNERKAILKSDGLVPAVSASDCRYWNLLGLTAVGADKKTTKRGNYHLVKVFGSHFVTLRRILAAHANRSGWNANNQLIHVANSTNILVEECECYCHHRHAISAWRSRNITARQNYINPRFHRRPGKRCDEAVVFYQSSRSIAENNISEGMNLGFQAHGGVTFHNQPGGSYNKFFGNIALDVVNATRTDARKEPHPDIKPAIANHFRDFLIVRPKNYGLWLSSTTETLVEHATIWGGGSAGFVAEPRSNAPCAEVPGGCCFTLVNSLVWGNAGHGIRSVRQDPWLVEYCNSYGNASGDYDPSEAIADDEGHIRRSLSVAPTGMGLGNGQCIVYVPETSDMKGAGRNGADIGANILYRYEDGALTHEPLWDPGTGEFPHGAIVPGINDIVGDSAFDVHKRLNVNCNGCKLPYAE